LTIHVLEDDFGVSDSLLTFLVGMGLDVIIYPDAESFFESEPPKPTDTVFVDLLLPGISGVQVIRWLQVLRQPPRVIAITGQPQSVIEHQIRGLKHVELLRKPLNAEAIAFVF
jgi:FixJ family two-component response regulator